MNSSSQSMFQTKANTKSSRELRQSGQVRFWRNNQSFTHGPWNSWLHLGNIWHNSPSLNFSKQIAQHSPLLPPPQDFDATSFSILLPIFTTKLGITCSIGTLLLLAVTCTGVGTGSASKGSEDAASVEDKHL